MTRKRKLKIINPLWEKINGYKAKIKCKICSKNVKIKNRSSEMCDVCYKNYKNSIKKNG